MGKLPIPLAGHCVVTVTWNGRNAALGISSVLYQVEFRRSSFLWQNLKKFKFTRTSTKKFNISFVHLHERLPIHKESL
jgi:hypothetical protein